jgi:hypothetical protein
VFGWATGGVNGGNVADYIGRKRTMLLAILADSLTTGLSAGNNIHRSSPRRFFELGLGLLALFDGRAKQAAQRALVRPQCAYRRTIGQRDM